MWQICQKCLIKTKRKKYDTTGTGGNTSLSADPSPFCESYGFTKKVHKVVHKTRKMAMSIGSRTLHYTPHYTSHVSIKIHRYSTSNSLESSISTRNTDNKSTSSMSVSNPTHSYIDVIIQNYVLPKP